MIRRPPRSTHCISSAASDVYKRQNSWRSCTPMRQPRCGAVAGVVGGRLVVAGGYNFYEKGLSSAEAWSPGRNRWIRLPRMPYDTTWEATACVLNGRLHVFSGTIDSSSSKHQVLERRGKQFRWIVKADLPDCPEGRFEAASIVHDGKIWVIGGYAGCLLYTSPSPRDGLLSRMPSSA